MSVDLSAAEAGMRAKLRNGDVLKIGKITPYDNVCYPFYVLFENGNGSIFARNGSYSFFKEGEKDIIEIFPHDKPEAVIDNHGITLRDLYFCAALTGLCAHPNAEVSKVGFTRAAFDLADEALNQRNQK